MPLGWWLARLAPAALLVVASCAAPPSPDVDGVRGTVGLGVVQGHHTYPPALVEEFRRFGTELKQTYGKPEPTTAVVARVSWDIAQADPRCEVAIALRHSADWMNYAWAGDGELMNATPNWWGLAQERYKEVRDPPLWGEPPFRLDVFMTGRLVASGRALTAWQVRGPLRPGDLTELRAYVAYGCKDNDSFVVRPIDIAPDVTFASAPPTP